MATKPETCPACGAWKSATKPLCWDCARADVDAYDEDTSTEHIGLPADGLPDARMGLQEMGLRPDHDGSPARDVSDVG